MTPAALPRIAVAAQGLRTLAPFGRGLNGALRAIQHLGYVQIDSIAVVERAHHHVLYNRVPAYTPAMLEQLLQQGHIFEYWAHAAAFLPMQDFRFSLPYKAAIQSGQVHWQRHPDQRMMAECLAAIRSDGPLRARDLESSADKKGGWWNWKPAKMALEQLYMQGDIMVAARTGFAKTYDLTERVLPAGVDTRMPSVTELAQHLVQQQLHSAGVVTLKGLSYLRRISGLRAAIADIVLSGLRQGSLLQVTSKHGTPLLLASADWQAAPRALSAAARRVHILSPFDPLVIQRERLQAVFDFNYQLECYVRAPLRRYGYFALPLLYGERFVGRMDCKAWRNQGQLAVQSLQLEPALQDNPDFQPHAAFWPALAHALQAYAEWQHCPEVTVAHTVPGAWRKPLYAALRDFAPL